MNASDTELKSKVKDVLNEARTLVLGAQVLLGFQYQAFFYPGFSRLPPAAQWANFGCLVLDMVILALLLAPAPFHRIAEDGNDSTLLKHFAARMIGTALPFLAVSFGLDLALISARTVGNRVAIAIGIGTILTALTLWIIMGLLNRHQAANRRQGAGRTASKREASSLEEKIETLTTEARVILPGVQALLGFQFAAMLTDKFETLPATSRLIHVGSLILIALAAILLIAPAAYHRLAANGNPREDVERFGTKAVLGALVPLAVGLAGELYVVAAIQFASSDWAIGAAGFAILLFAGFWALYPLTVRKMRAAR
ncbi:MAG: putative rane protein [Rhodospirillales bacterium]|nr:putative rane protein [Rhodospirillales bacterium]